MKKIEQIKQELQNLARTLETQDNACTAHPIYFVQKLERVYGFDTSYFERDTQNIAWIDVCNDYSEVTQDSDPVEFARLEAIHDAGGDPGDEWSRTGFQDVWETVQPFLTKLAAERYLGIDKAKGIRKDVRVYVDSGYRNAEWQYLRELPRRILEALDAGDE